MKKLFGKLFSGKVGIVLILLICGGGAFGVSFLVMHKQLAPKEPSAEELAAQMTAEQTLLNSLAAAEGRRLQPQEQELNQLIKDVRIRLQQLDRRERELDEREHRLTVAGEHLAGKARDLERLRVELAAAYTPLKESRSELMKDRTLIRNQEVINAQNTAKMWAKMDPANCARLVVEMFSNSQADAATKIIHFLPEKNWAAVMDEIQEIGPAVDVILRQLKVVREIQAS